MFSPFSRKLQFAPIDPLADGTDEEIALEQSNPDNIAFQNDIDGQSLTDFWNEVGKDIHKK